MYERAYDPMGEQEPEDTTELTLNERYELATRKIIEVYGQCLQDGQYDMAWNKLSPHLYNLRSLHYERLQQEPEPKPLLTEMNRLYSE